MNSHIGHPWAVSKSSTFSELTDNSLDICKICGSLSETHNPKLHQDLFADLNTDVQLMLDSYNQRLEPLLKHIEGEIPAISLSEAKEEYNTPQKVVKLDRNPVHKLMRTRTLKLEMSRMIDIAVIDR